MKNKWIDFGWFGPCLTFNKNNDPEEPNRLVISLFICKLYITIPKLQKSYKKPVGIDYKVYGLDSGSDPDRLVWMWGDYHRVIRMPWTNVIVNREICDNENLVVVGGLMTFDECKKLALEKPSIYMKQYSYTNIGQHNYEYFVNRIMLRPLIFKNRDWKWCTKESFEVYVKLEKSFHGINELKFNTDVDILIGQQINLHLMIYDKNYTDF